MPSPEQMKRWEELNRQCQNSGALSFTEYSMLASRTIREFPAMLVELTHQQDENPQFEISTDALMKLADAAVEFAGSVSKLATETNQGN